MTAGRPPHEPTEKTRAEVSALYSYGVPLAEIAAYIGIDPKTLDKHYRPELDIAKAKSHAAVGKFLYQAASGALVKEGATHSDCVRAAMFWAKTQMGFRETQAIEHTSPDGSMTPKAALDVSNLSDAALRELAAIDTNN